MSSAAGTATRIDGGDLEHVAEVEAERHRADHQVHVERHAEPDAAERDRQVGAAAREHVGADGAEDQQRRGSRRRRRAGRSRERTWPAGSAGTDSGIESPISPKTSTPKKSAIWVTISGCTRPGRRSDGQRGERQQAGADRYREAAGEGDDAVLADDEARAWPARGARTARSSSRTRCPSAPCDRLERVPRRCSARATRGWRSPPPSSRARSGPATPS